ncbi:hypothetical protein PENSTE_c004G02272 [Penicillium steckii]|uniref:Uncharacterized protein n=1 Tax=Penicillium steckii TaxID=303698 RepID=A0A1V6TM52_9EURO|nr:hypothetical protein PENSTE_c004G02272 [Penicillium steckii]
MGCFRQMFRCMIAPFKREQPRVLEIGPPTNFRKEEPPACFSDAESVLSPKQTPIERPILTKETQHIDVSGQPRNSDGEDRNDDRDNGLPAIAPGDAPESCSTDEHQAVSTRFRDRVRPSRWFKSTKDAVLPNTGCLINE